MLLVVDNGSVYTQNLVDFLETLKIKFQIKKPSLIKQNDLQNFSSFILSGRRHNDKEMNSKNSMIIKFAISNSIPLLGICYGAEILSLTVGGTIKKMPSLHKGLVKVIVREQNPLAENELQVFESHSYEISKLSQKLICIGSSNSCQNEIVQLENSKIFGTQFHPEMSDDGKKLIQKFCELQY